MKWVGEEELSIDLITLYSFYMPVLNDFEDMFFLYIGS